MWTTLGAIYDPLADSWTPVDPPSGWDSIGDAQSVVLPNGTFMLANCCSTETALLDAEALTWTATGAGKSTVNDEEGWTLLPGLSGHVLTVDAYVFTDETDGTNSEIYDPATGTWSSAGSTIVQLWDSYPDANHSSHELGPAVLRPDGTVFATGATGAPHTPGHTAIYDSHSGVWIPGPDFPHHFDVADGPAALLPNGNVLVQTSPGIFKRHSDFVEWNGTSLVDVPAPPPANSEPSYLGNMVGTIERVLQDVLDGRNSLDGHQRARLGLSLFRGAASVLGAHHRLRHDDDYARTDVRHQRTQLQRPFPGRRLRR